MHAKVDTEAGKRAGVSDGDSDSVSTGEALHDAARRISELRAYVSYFISTQLDRLKLTARNLIVMAILGVVGLIAVAAIVVTAAVQLLQGIAGAIAVICGDRGWIGDLVCGIVVLGAIACVVLYGVSRLTKTSRGQTVSKYESRKQQQRLDLGEDVQQRADYAKTHGIGGSSPH